MQFKISKFSQVKNFEKFILNKRFEPKKFIIFLTLDEPARNFLNFPPHKKSFSIFLIRTVQSILFIDQEFHDIFLRALY